MKHRIIILLLAAGIFLELSSQDISLINSDELVSLSRTQSDTTYVINFWATWCSPCVKEIEFFEELHADNKNEKLKVVLVSLDFPNQMDKRLLPFLEKKDITAPVRLMTDLDYNGWIDRIDASWSGAIPATLIFNKDQRVFLEQELTRQELVHHVNQIRN